VALKDGPPQRRHVRSKAVCKSLSSLNEGQVSYTGANSDCLYFITLCGDSFFLLKLWADDSSDSVYKSRTKEPKICWKCLPPKTVKDTPALKRHCSELHRQDIVGNPISVDLFPCAITTCHKHTEPFKRREKLAHHIRTFHAAIIESEEVNGGILAGQRDAALTTNNTAEAGDYFRGNYGAARMSATVYNNSAEVSVWNPAVFEGPFSLPVEVLSAPVANDFDTLLSSVRSQALQLWKMFLADLDVSDSKNASGCQFST
jgi:hypothetical protein